MSGLSPGAFASLRRFSGVRDAAVEHCEFCSDVLSPEHGHLVNVAQRALLCVCRPCYLLFTHDGAGGARFRSVPDRYCACAGDGGLDPEVRRALDVPVGVAFFFMNSVLGRIVAQYPSPAGATEAELPDEAWASAVTAAPMLASLQPDVEALLVRRHADGATEAFLVPIDACYELVGRIRQSWRGFQGGEEAWRDIDAFFARVAARARREVVA